MREVYLGLSFLLILVHALPWVRHQHWFFRIWDFGRLQLLVFQLVVLVLGLVCWFPSAVLFRISLVLVAGCAVHNLVILTKYTPVYRWFFPRKQIPENHSEPVTVLSVNVYQYNTNYEALVQLIEREKPDIILTMESGKDWEEALIAIEGDYPNHQKIAQENTYGIHFYTSLKANNISVRYHVAEDVPSIEAELETKDGKRFAFFGVHPPPPSPTEEETSKERDGEILSVAKQVKHKKMPVLVIGDFNNVAWSRSSRLFRKASELVDARIGRGIIATFHAQYKILRFPIDLVFHSPDIVVDQLCTLENIGSDHFPVFCRFYLTSGTDKDEDPDVETLEEEEEVEVSEMIRSGKEEEGSREAT